MTKAEIQEFIDSFAKSSKLLKDAGVDGVEVHAVHEGYLLDQFTLHYVNKRTDEYGGSLENRYRFAAEIVKAIKAACGPDFPVSLRYSVVSKTKGFRQGARRRGVCRGGPRHGRVRDRREVFAGCGL